MRLLGPLLSSLGLLLLCLSALTSSSSSFRLLPKPEGEAKSALSMFATSNMDELGSAQAPADDADGDDDDDGSSSSSASSSSSEQQEEEATEDDDDEEEEEESTEFVENVVGWRPTKGKCAEGKFLDAETAECRPCSICGPDLYEREHCLPDKDTVCDWCLTSNPSAVRNRDFRAKCEQLVALRREFRTALAHRRTAAGQAKPALLAVAMENVSKWWKTEMLVEMAFYLALIALVLAIIRFLTKNRPTTYRTVTVTPPMLEEWEQKNIVRAAESIRDKLGNKGYAKLEEEFI